MLSSQGILHNSKLHNDSDDSLRRRTRRDSVRFQSIITSEKGTGDGVVDPEALSLTQDFGKDLTDRTDSVRFFCKLSLMNYLVEPVQCTTGTIVSPLPLKQI